MKTSYSSKRFILLFLLLILAIIVFFIDLFTGSVSIPAIEIVKIIFTNQSIHTEWQTIISDFRLPRAMTAILAGAALSVSGLQMQTIFRNPLAGPDVLGITSGASLGVAFTVLGISALLPFDTYMNYGNWAMIVSACLGAGLILIIVFLVSLKIRNTVTILILGMMFGSAVIAVVSIMQYFSPASTLKAFVIWTFGSLSGVTKTQLYLLMPVVILGIILSAMQVKTLNVLLLGENYAKSLGLNIRKSRFLVFFSTSILAGSITAFCGPIGFVGIAVPHIARLLFKTSNHKILIPATLLIGIIMMLVSDIFSQLPGNDAVLPINSVTALLGIPIIIWIIMKNKKIS